jgi:tight adherence protein C
VTSAIDPEILKLVGLAGMFATVSVAAYILFKSHAERVSVRAGLESALSNAALSDDRSLVLRVPFMRRILRPASGRLARVVYRLGPEGIAQGTKKRLVLAGLSDRYDADTFLALSAALPIFLGVTLYAYSQFASVSPFAWFILIPASATLPNMWLTSKIETRQRKIRLALADTLDLMTIAVEAGLGFDAALARVVSAIPGPLSDELYRLLQEVRIGVRRADALNGLSERTQVGELDQFITAINQADVFGISIGQVLRIQAGQLRQKRSQLAEERAAKTPVKLLFPLILCIFPALFTVLVGPAAIAIMDNLFGNL